MNEIQNVTSVDLGKNATLDFILKITDANSNTTTIELKDGVKFSIDEKDKMTYSYDDLAIQSRRFLYDGKSKNVDTEFVKNIEAGLVIWDMSFVGGEDTRDGLNDQSFRVGLAKDTFLKMNKYGSEGAKIRIIKSK